MAQVQAKLKYAPEVNHQVSAINVAEDQQFSYALDAIYDPDAVQGQSLTYTATMADGSSLPAWVSFNSATRT